MKTFAIPLTLVAFYALLLLLAHCGDTPIGQLLEGCR